MPTHIHVQNLLFLPLVHFWFLNFSLFMLISFQTTICDYYHKFWQLSPYELQMNSFIFEFKTPFMFFTLYILMMNVALHRIAFGNSIFMNNCSISNSKIKIEKYFIWELIVVSILKFNSSMVENTCCLMNSHDCHDTN